MIGPFIRAADVHWGLEQIDFNEICAIEEMCFKDQGVTREHLSFLMRQPNVATMVAVRREVTSGFLMYALAADEKTVAILQVAVHPHDQRKGVGRELVTSALKAIRRSPRKRERVTLTVIETNVAAQNFFKACGFRWIKTYPKALDGLDLYHFEMPIQEQ